MDKRDAILSLMETRRSCRNFKSETIPSEILEKILRAGTFAATGRNRQSPIIIAVTNKELRDEISLWNRKIMGTDTDPFYNAPVVPRTWKTALSLWAISCLLPTPAELPVAGSIGQRRNLKVEKEKNC